MKKNYRNIVAGIIVILLALFLFGNIFKWWSFDLLFDGWWTVFIFVPCIVSIFTDGFRTYNILGISIAALLLLCAQNVINWGDIWKFFLPILLVVIGIKLIFGKNIIFTPKVREDFAKFDGKKHIFTATFAGNKVVVPMDFVSGEATATFGGIEVDFRNYTPTSDIYLRADAIFGGVEVYVPHNMKILVQSNNFFGGTDDHTSHSRDNELTHTLYIQTNAIFGGVDIKY